jgi:hypothetical protein
MKRSKLFICVLAAAGFAIGVQAQKAYESFNYEVGSNLYEVSNADDETAGWSTGWYTSNTPTVSVEAGQNYLDKETVGNLASIRNGAAVRDLIDGQWPDEEGRIYWASLLMQPSDLTTERWTGFLIRHVNEDGTDTGAMIGLTWSAANWGGYLTSGETVSTVPAVLGKQTLCVMRIEMSGDEASEQVYFWINPDVTATDLDIIDAAFQGGVDLSGGINQVGISCADGLNMMYDEIYLGTSWSDVNLYKGNSIDKTSAKSASLTCTPSLVSESATIKYDLATSQQVKVSLYNALGSEVAVLVNENQAAGSQTATLSAAGLSDGMYFCKLQAGSEVSVKQIIIKK